MQTGTDASAEQFGELGRRAAGTDADYVAIGKEIQSTFVDGHDAILFFLRQNFNGNGRANS